MGGRIMEWLYIFGAVAIIFAFGYYCYKFGYSDGSADLEDDINEIRNAKK